MESPYLSSYFPSTMKPLSVLPHSQFSGVVFGACARLSSLCSQSVGTQLDGEDVWTCAPSGLALRLAGVVALLLRLLRSAKSPAWGNFLLVKRAVSTIHKGRVCTNRSIDRSIVQMIHALSTLHTEKLRTWCATGESKYFVANSVSAIGLVSRQPYMPLSNLARME